MLKIPHKSGLSNGAVINNQHPNDSKVPLGVFRVLGEACSQVPLVPASSEEKKLKPRLRKSRSPSFQSPCWPFSRPVWGLWDLPLLGPPIMVPQASTNPPSLMQLKISFSKSQPGRICSNNVSACSIHWNPTVEGPPFRGSHGRKELPSWSWEKLLNLESEHLRSYKNQIRSWMWMYLPLLKLALLRMSFLRIP